MKEAKYGLLPVADPGFPLGGGANSGWGRRQHTILPNFPQNCIKLKEFGPPQRGGVPRAPLRSVTDYKSITFGGKKSFYSQKKLKFFAYINVYFS